MDNIAVLAYHSIDNSQSILSVKPSIFRKQMEFLKQSDFQIISTHEILKNNDSSTQKIILTFDDGFENFYTEAFPILYELKIPATLFIVPNYVNKNNNWPTQPSWVNSQKLMTWNQIKEVANCGIEIGSHTLNHPFLSSLNQKELLEEITISKKKLEEYLGQSVESFAYPYGDYNDNAKLIVAKEYSTAYTTNMGYIEVNSSPYEFERIDVYYLRNINIFKRIFTQSFNFYLELRTLLRNVKGKIRG